MGSGKRQGASVWRACLQCSRLGGAGPNAKCFPQALTACGSDYILLTCLLWRR